MTCVWAVVTDRWRAVPRLGRVRLGCGILAVFLPVAGYSETYAELKTAVHLARDAGDPHGILKAVTKAREAAPGWEGGLYPRLLVEAIGGLPGPTGGDAELGKAAYALKRELRAEALKAPIHEQLSFLVRFGWNGSHYSPAYDEFSFAQRRALEAETMLQAWRNAEIEFASKAGALPASSGTRPPSGLTAAELAKWHVKAKEFNDYYSFRNEYHGFTNRGPQVLADLYLRPPLDFDELLSLTHHYMPAEIAGQAWQTISNKVVASKISKAIAAVAIASPKPLTLLLKAPEARTNAAASPSVPAVARPSKLRERLATQGKPGMAASVPSASGSSSTSTTGGVESAASEGATAHGTPIWTWVALGGVALAGGWVWLRQRN